MKTPRGLVHLLESQVMEVDARMSEVGEQREENHKNYSLQPLGNEIPGRSSYISPDVMDQVESKKAYFKEVFFSGRRVAKFRPVGDEQAEMADLKTAYVENQFERNNFYRTFRDSLHDAFVAKRMVLHVEWKDSTQVITTELKGVHPGMVQMMVQQQENLVEVDDSEVEQGEQGLEGTIRFIVDDSKAVIKLIQPERYYRDPYATYVDEAVYASYEEDTNRGDLIRDGFDPEQIDGLKTDHRFRREEEDNARKSHDSSWTRRTQHKRERDQEVITTYWTYTWSNLNEYYPGEYPDESRLYKVRWGSGEVLRYEDGELCIQEVDEMPFLEWCPYKISHAESGLCDADIMAHSQKTTSTLKRLAIDNQQMRNLSRVEAVQGNIKNPRELLNPNIGGVLWTKQIGSVAPLPAPELSQMTMSIIEMMDTDKENRGGLSRLAKGMNKDAVSEQNADNMIDRLTQASNRRVMAEVRDYALTCWVPLMQTVYRLGARNDQKIYQLEAVGKMSQIRPDQWPDVEVAATVHPALTPEQGMQFAQGLMMMDGLLKQDPLLSPLYGVDKRHALADDIFDAIGVMDTSRYMTRPGSPEFKDLMDQQAQQGQQQQEMQMQEQAFQRQMMQSSEERNWYLTNLQGQSLQVDATDKTTDNARQDEELAHKKVYDFKSLELEAKKVAKTSG